MTTIEVSQCCEAELVEDFKNNPNDHHDPIEIYTCKKCKKERRIILLNNHYAIKCQT